MKVGQIFLWESNRWNRFLSDSSGKRCFGQSTIHISIFIVIVCLLLAFLRLLTSLESLLLVSLISLASLLLLACLLLHNPLVLLVFLLLLAFLLLPDSLSILVSCVTVAGNIYVQYLTVQWDISGYQIIGLRLSDCHFFLLSDYLKLLDIRSRPQSIGLSDIGLTKNYRLPTSVHYILLTAFSQADS